MMRQVLIILVFFMITPLTYAQESGKDSLKVGLVLSGGGAKGLAHIGVLKVIEEAGVKIDYIGGTSMGAIVGALYASGYSASELDSIFRSTDFMSLIQDKLPRDAKTFYEKEDSERYALTLPFDKFKISFPEAISGGQNIYNTLVRLLFHVKDVDDFNELSIPFFCIATNVETGEEVLLNKGYLPEAIMASGTFPTLFEPSEIDGKILIDGGVVNNYPVEELKKLGANFIIGSDVQHGLSDRESLMSATEVLLQINNYRTVKDMENKCRLTDIYIKPDIENFSVIDFDLAEAIVENGEVAASHWKGELKELGQEQGRILETRPRVMPHDSVTVNRLIIKGTNNYSRGYVKGKLRLNLSETVSFDKLQAGISNLSATGNFKTIRYELLSNGVGEDLVLHLIESENKTLIRLGVHYDDLYKSAALINLTKKSLMLDDDVASFDFILGDHLRYKFHYYVDKGFYWSFGLSSKYSSFDQDINYAALRSNLGLPVDNNINTINLNVTDLTNQVYLQTVVKEEFAVSLGAEHKFLKYDSNTLNEIGEEGETDLYGNIFEKSNIFSTYAKVTLDTYDDKYFPTRGLYFNGDFHFYIYSSDYANNFREFSIAKARIGTAVPLTDRWTFQVETEGGFKLGTSSVASMDFILGGFGSDAINNFRPFIGYDFLSLPGNSFVKAYGKIDYRFASKSHLMFAANFANVDDDLFRTGEWFTAPNFSGYGVGYGWESFIGPVQVLYSWSPEIESSNLFFSIGYWF